ncbi:amidohydrolase [Brenneria roseae subsp. americana]|uniref:Amidohydrolase n=1 Tax=Brenneria roseae subsp. americana TaxID=1508507 RepID=A0A2U1TS97_9GAMM|nr:amidohydrolase [Brenneria roseae]PWC12294.1 amidohydrolase [Brenneria roseae subsp. americana]
MKDITLQQLIDWRREFHQFPEEGWSEFVTTAKIITRLRAMGYRVQAGKKNINEQFIRGRNDNVVEKGLAAAYAQNIDPTLLAEMDGLTGCVALLDSGRPGPTIALRFDIDCVLVQETASPDHIPNQAQFASVNPGKMHACGHDGHTAIGLGIAQWLMQQRNTLNGRFKLIFQPAEEGVRGARPIAESGILDDVDYFLALHLGTVAKSNEVLVDPQGFLCTTKLDFRFYGVPAHAGADPQKGHNALAGGCHCTIQLLGIARHGDGMSQINVGVIRAGEGRNVIPAKAELQIEVRGATKEINDYMTDRAMRIAQGAAHSFDLRLETEITGEAVDLRNDPEMIEVLKQAIAEHPSLKVVSHHFGGSEDATILARRVQDKGGKALYFILGSDLTAGHHQSNFDFDEQSLLTGVELFAGCIQRLCKM